MTTKNEHETPCDKPCPICGTPTYLNVGLKYIMIDDDNGPVVHMLMNIEMAARFSPEQIAMLKEGKRILCNNHHGNTWVKNVNALACDMSVITRKFMNI